MLRYKLKNNNNKWKMLLSKVAELDSLDSATMDNIVQTFYDQIKKDKLRLDNGLSVSDCAFNTPRVRSSIDKQTRFAHNIALKFFPLEENDKPLKVKKQYSYIRYSQLLGGLTRKFKDHIESEEEERQKYKQVRKYGERKNFCTLKKKPLTTQITNPVPMPVTVPPLEELEPFFSYLREGTFVSDINKNGNDGGNNDGADYIEFKRGVHYDDGRIDLCKQVVGSPWIGNLMSSIKDNPHIDHFLLGNNIIEKIGAFEIAKFIESEHAPKIKTWYIAGNKIDPEGIEKICVALENDTDADALWLKRNPIGPDGSAHIGNMLKKNKTLKILDMHNTGIFDKGTQHIMEGLKENRNLRLLYMDANGITPVGVQYICDYFNDLVDKNEKGITSIWLDMNRLDDIGIIMLAESVKNYKFLKRLILGSNRMGPDGANAILESLVHHQSIKVLDLGMYKATSDMGELPNNMGDDSVDAICHFIKNNKSVQVMSIIHNGISLKGLERICDSMEKNDTILFLNYAQYGVKIPKEIRKRFRDKMEENIQNKLGVSYQDLINVHLRFIKHTKRIRNIDSIYRNNM